MLLAFLSFPVHVRASEQAPVHAKTYLEPVSFDWKNLIHRSQLAGLHVFEGDHLVLITDRPCRAGDDIEEFRNDEVVS